MRLVGGLISVVLAFAGNNPAEADSTINYSAGGGVTSNVFQDPTDLSAPYGDAKLGLRGTLELEGSQLDYALAVSGRQVPRYRFADQRTVGIETGYRRDLAEGVVLTLKGGLELRRSGDIFLALPGVLLGYRKNDLTSATSAGVTAEHGGGKSHLTAAFSALRRGKAHFTLTGLRPTRLEAHESLLELTGGHIRPLLGGEIGATVQYRTSLIPRHDRQGYDRFPAQTLRGSIAYGRQIGDSLTLLGEIGLVGVESPYLGESVRRLRPFLKAEATWQPRAGLTFAATLAEDSRLFDIDDALGEHVRTTGLSIEKVLSERLKAGLAFEQAYSDWLYYDYRTRTRTLAATLTVGLSGKHALIVEYSHLVRHENDKAADFKVDGLAARIAGEF